MASTKMPSKPLIAIGAAAALAAGSLGAGLGLTLAHGSSISPGALAPASSKASFAYYKDVVRRFTAEQLPGSATMMGGHGSMMGDAGYSWMMGRSGYSWMMGGTNAPGWMTGGSLPASMMGAKHDMGQVMGELFANGPGPRVSRSRAAELATEGPAGATVDRAGNTITFSGQSVDLAVTASRSTSGENFRSGGLTNPTVVVPQGAHVQVEVVNADPDSAHGFVVAAQGSAASPMPMMTAEPAFTGAFLWFLGDPTAAGLHAGTVSFTAAAAGAYSYLCPVPGHAAQGMAGTFVVRPAGAS